MAPDCLPRTAPVWTPRPDSAGAALGAASRTKRIRPVPCRPESLKVIERWRGVNDALHRPIEALPDVLRPPHRHRPGRSSRRAKARFATRNAAGAPSSIEGPYALAHPAVAGTLRLRLRRSTRDRPRRTGGRPPAPTARIARRREGGENPPRTRRRDGCRSRRESDRQPTPIEPLPPRNGNGGKAGGGKPEAGRPAAVVRAWPSRERPCASAAPARPRRSIQRRRMVEGLLPGPGIVPRVEPEPTPGKRLIGTLREAAHVDRHRRDVAPTFHPRVDARRASPSPPRSPPPPSRRPDLRVMTRSPTRSSRTPPASRRPPATTIHPRRSDRRSA